MSKVAGINECVEDYASRMGVSKTVAENMFKTALDVMCDAIVDGGVSFKGKFTIKHKVKAGRSGSMNGHDWQTEDSVSLKLTVGSDLEKALNE